MLPMLITVAVLSEGWTVFPTQTLWSWIRLLEAWISAFILCLCVCSSLATGRSPVQGVLPTVYKLKKLKRNEAFHSCITLQREQPKTRMNEYVTKRLHVVGLSINWIHIGIEYFFQYRIVCYRYQLTSWRRGDTLYVHSAVSNRIQLKERPRSSQEVPKCVRILRS
jgi:hypothetical protein